MKRFILPLTLLSSLTIHAQFGGIKDLTKKALDKDPFANILKKKPAISTSLEDVKMEGYLNESFANDSVFSPLLSLKRTDNGGFILQPGLYRYQSQSYCLKAGTHGPGGGDGYMFAATEGPMEEIVMSVVRNSTTRTEIPQQKVQQLLWSIIAHTKVEDLQNEIKLVATQLLTSKQIIKLNGGALGLVPDAAMQKGMATLPQGVRDVMEAEAKLRRMLTDPTASFADMERVAVLTGMAPLGPGSREMPSGRWSLHPDGYYVRYLPSGYSFTRVEVWVPQGSASVGKEFDPATHIAVPGNTSRQRLIQSGRSHKEQ